MNSRHDRFKGIPTTSDEVHIRLAGRLGREPDSDTWTLLVDDGDVQDVLHEFGYDSRTGESRLMRLEDKYRRLERYRANGRAPRSEPQAPSADARDVALAAILAVEASRNPGVRDFRTLALAGRVLSDPEALEWLVSQARRDGEATVWASVALTPADACLREGPLLQRIEDVVRRAREEAPSWAVRFEAEILEIRIGDQIQHLPIRTCSSSVLATLRDLAQELAARYGWAVTDSARFVLTGTAPVPSVLVRTLPQRDFPPLGTIVLEVAPRTRPADVARIFAEQRRVVLGGGRERSIGGNRARLALFAVEHDARLRGWQQVMDDWNELHPDDRYTDVRQFSRDSRAGYEAVTGARWRERNE